jgi:hypothetical protein
MTALSASALAPLFITVAIVMSIVVLAFVHGVRAINRHVARLDAESSNALSPSMSPYRMSESGADAHGRGTDLAPLYYLVSVLFWPAAFVLGANLLREARTARVGRACMVIGMSIIAATAAVISAASVASVLWLRASAAPETTIAEALEDESSSEANDLPPYDPRVLANVVSGGVGEVVRVGDLVIQVHSVERVILQGTDGVADAARVSLDISFRNEGRHLIRLGPQHLTVFDEDGFAARRTVARGKHPELTHSSLTPGNVTRGWVTFEIPPGSRLHRLQVFGMGGVPTSHVAEIRLTGD